MRAQYSQSPIFTRPPNNTQINTGTNMNRVIHAIHTSYIFTLTPIVGLSFAAWFMYFIEMPYQLELSTLSLEIEKMSALLQEDANALALLISDINSMHDFIMQVASACIALFLIFFLIEMAGSEDDLTKYFQPSAQTKE